MKKPETARKGSDGKAAAKQKLPDFSHSLPMLLLRGREAVMRYFRPSLLEHDVTEQQWRVLRALTTVDEMEVMMLADATYLLPPSMSRILKDLQRRGLVTRRSDRNDLRRNLVAITPKGNDLISTLSPRSEAAISCRSLAGASSELFALVVTPESITSRSSRQVLTKTLFLAFVITAGYHRVPPAREDENATTRV